jgi:hypothetical protein
MANKYFLAMERADGTMDAPFHSLSTKASALRVGSQIAKSGSWDCVALWIEDGEGNGIKKYPMKGGE